MDVFQTDIHDEEETASLDDDVISIAHEFLPGSQQCPRQPLLSLVVDEEKSPSKSPNIAEAFAQARNAKKRKGITC